MPRRRYHDEHTNHEAWAIPYGDLITLLLAFFVVMYAISSVNEGKYRVLSYSLSEAFRGAPRTVAPVHVGDPALGRGSAQQMSRVTQVGLDASGQIMLDRAPFPSVSSRTAVTARVDVEQEPPLMASTAEANGDLGRLADSVEEVMRRLIAAEQLQVRRRPGQLEIEIRTDLLFASGSAELERSAVAALQQLGDVLRTGSHSIRVEGHTDDRSINTTKFPSNWELSAARAASVVRILIARGVQPSRFSVMGLGEFRPAQSNSTPEGRRANRRVLVVILDERSQREGATPTVADEQPGQSSPRPEFDAGARGRPQPGAPAKPSESAAVAATVIGSNAAGRAATSIR